MLNHKMMDTNRIARLDLRILATSDLHMNLLGYDYFLDRESRDHGLARLAGLIREYRTGHGNCLLFDNGDTIQGTPLGDFLAEADRIGTDHIHPMIAAMNQLRYDAATLGNHDFAFGGDFLLKSTSGAIFPVVATNLSMAQPGPLRRSVILRRDFADRDGRRHSLGIGVIGFLPPQTTDWESDLPADTAVEDIVLAAERETSALKAQGADVIVALAHSGIGDSDHRPGMENAALPLAAVTGIDALVTGHIHRLFPSPDFPARPGVDPIGGRLHGKPAVMPGFWGSHLGVIDLELRATGNGWRVGAATSRVLRVPRDMMPDPAIARIAANDHRDTLRHYARPVGRTVAPLNSFLSLVGKDAGLKLVNRAQAWFVGKALAETEFAALPVLSASAPCRAGGLGGVSHYTNVPAGQISLRNLADIYLFPNRISALELTGAQILDWLERSAGIFRQVGQVEGPLLNNAFPSYNFDTIDGLEWRIDLTRPARYDIAGTEPAASASRIRDLRFNGCEVAPTDRFILATSSYRLTGCGLFAPIVRAARIVMDSPHRTRDLLRDYVAEQGVIAMPDHLGFRFIAPKGTTATFETSPEALPCLDRIAPLRPEIIPPCDLTASGFLHLRLHL